MSARVFRFHCQDNAFITTGTATFADLVGRFEPAEGDMVVVYFNTGANRTNNGSAVITDADSLIPTDVVSAALYLYTGAKWVPVASAYDSGGAQAPQVVGASTILARGLLMPTSVSDATLTNAVESATNVIAISKSSAAITTGLPVPVAYKGPVTVSAVDKIDIGGYVKSYGGGYAGQGLIAQVSLNAAIAGIGYANQPTSDQVEVVSSNAGDTTQTVTLYFTIAATPTVVQTEVIALNGTTAAASVATTIDVVHGFVVNAAHAGTVTVRVKTGPATIGTLTTGNLTSGITTLADPRAYLQIPTVVASGSSSKQIAVAGYLYSDTAFSTLVYECATMNGTTPVALTQRYARITKIFAGNLESSRTVTAKSSATVDATSMLIGRSVAAISAGQNGLINFGL